MLCYLILLIVIVLFPDDVTVLLRQIMSEARMLTQVYMMMIRAPVQLIEQSELLVKKVFNAYVVILKCCWNRLYKSIIC